MMVLDTKQKIGSTPLRSLRVIVVGGGAAGLMAAWRAATLGHRVVLLEANPRLGAKLRISGGGKCNITHAGPVNSLLASFRKEQARFLRYSLHAFGNREVLELLAKEGVETYVRENGRVFPQDRPGSAAAVVLALENLVRRAGVHIRLEARVAALRGDSPHLQCLQLEGGESIEADHFILATGGASYPQTGTRGEVLAWLRELDIPVVPWFPALAPIPLRKAFQDWEGLPFRGGTLLLLESEGGRRLARHKGDILFTRTAITGPSALELSRETEEARRSGKAWLAYSFTPEPTEHLDGLLIEEQRKNPHLSIRHCLQRWMPERVAETVPQMLQVPPDQRLKDLPRSARRRLIALLQAFPLGEPESVKLERGEVSAGGVRLDAVDPRSMRLKGWDNLRICGELLDVDGPVGGYNLQAAFSTGFVAGELTDAESW